MHGANGYLRDQFLRAAYRKAGGQGAWIVSNGLDIALARQSLTEGADLVAFGRPFIANPDLTPHLREGASFNEPDRATFYGGGANGYTDYPVLAWSRAGACRL